MCLCRLLNHLRSLLQSPIPFFPLLPHVSLHPLFILLTCTHCPSSLLCIRAAMQPSASILKDCIAALQQHNGSLSLTPSPTSSHHNASITPLRGSLHNKIAEFER